MLERGRIGERWRTERWDSLRLLTPSWMTRLPGWQYRGGDDVPPRGPVRHLLDRYAASFGAPVVKANVEAVSCATGRPRYLVVTDRGTWRAHQVVVATGPHGIPHVPAVSEAAVSRSSRRRRTATPLRCRPAECSWPAPRPRACRSPTSWRGPGRPVVLAVGRHTRLPRRYRGMDIFWWLERTGRLARTIDQVPNAPAARREPSMQLIGRTDEPLDLAALQAIGVRLTGRLEHLTGGRAWFRDDLAHTVAAADRKMHRFLDAVDAYAEQTGHQVRPAVRPGAVQVPAAPARIDLRAERIGTIVLATGYRPHHPWLRLPISAPDGNIEQYRGVTAAPGVYVVGQRFQHRRDSSFIDGARHDAQAVVRHLLRRSGGNAARPEPDPAEPDRIKDVA